MSIDTVCWQETTSKITHTFLGTVRKTKRCKTTLDGLYKVLINKANAVLDLQIWIKGKVFDMFSF